MQFTIRTARADELSSALHFFYGHHAEAERELLVAGMLDAHHSGGISLAQSVIARSGPALVGVMLVQLQPDHSAFFWIPVVKEIPEASDIANELLQAACDSMARENVSFAQVILTPEGLNQTEFLQGHQFEQLAEISYLQRSLADAIPTQEQDFTLVLYNEHTNRDRFVKLLESTYQGTLDCASPTEDNDGHAALLGHRYSGTYTPEHWLIFEVAGEDVALLLLNDHPEQSAWEIVYMGVSPRFRGNGYGKMILVEGLARAARNGRDSVILAVDRSNHFAFKIYEAAGFVPIATGTVFSRSFLEG
jgi:ribosomal protein S18 acetylase RimI-like enzyme